MKDTFAVQSLNVALELPPLQANAVGQLLAGTNTKQFNLFFAALRRLLALPRLWLKG